MIFKHLQKYILCIALLCTMPAVETNAQATQTFKSVSKWFVKKTAKEGAEEAVEQGVKNISKEMFQKTLTRNAKNVIFDSSTTLAREGAQEFTSTSISKTLTKKVGKELGESALKTVSKEFAQQIGKTTSNEATELFAKRIGTEGSQEISELSAKKSMQRSAFDTKKSWAEKAKDKYQQLRISTLQKVQRSKIQKELLEMYSKGPIELTEKELNELLANPKYFNSFVRKTGSKSKSVQTKIEFFIRLKQSKHPEYVEKILSNPEIVAKMEGALRGQGYMHEWLMVKNFKDFLLNPKWGKEGDFLALALPKLTQRTDNVIFKVGGKHGSTNSTKFHNGLAKVIDQSSSIEELFVNIRRYAKQNLSTSAYNDFLRIFEQTLEAV